MRELFKIRPIDLTEYLLLLMTVAMLPWSWSYALYGGYLLMLNTIAKCIVDRKIGNPALSRTALLALASTVALVGWYAVSLLWTSNMDNGVGVVSKMASLPLLALVFLASDMSYFSRKHLLAIFYVLGTSLAALFLVRLGINIRRVLTEDITFVSRMCFGFDKRHHSYMSMYVIVVLWGMYAHQVSDWKSFPRIGKVLFSLLLILLVAYMVIINSRAGILFLLLSILLMSGHAFFAYGRRVSSVASCLVALMVAVGVHYALPKTQNRVSQTSLTEEAAAVGTTEQASRPDKRLVIWQSSLQLAKENWGKGVGVGDRFDCLKPIYESYGDQESIDRKKNSHNQFLDTLVCTGIVGLALFVLLFVLILVESVKKKNFLLLVFLLNLGFNSLFESLLDRQMGLIFIGLFLGLLMLDNKTKYNHEKV